MKLHRPLYLRVMKLNLSPNPRPPTQIAGKIGGFALAGVFLAIAVGVLTALPTWCVWNLVVPEVFGLPEISLPQALGLTVLLKLFFGTYVKFETNW